MTREPYNLDIHAHLTALGFELTQYEADFDDGDPENGPGIYGCPPFDEYRDSSEYICIDMHGEVVNREDRDLALEAWIDAQYEEHAK
jgi:hypothetical protein